MTNKLSVLKPIVAEVLIVLLFVFVVNNYFGNQLTDLKTITGDGAGYYDYLPSVFIFQDINRHNYSETEKIEFEKRVSRFGFYLDYKDYKVDRYPCGTALLQSPFFIYTCITTDMQGTYDDGYQMPFHFSVFLAAIFYLFLALILFRKILKLYLLRRSTIILSQFLLVFSTSVIQYTSSNSAFSHVYSLFAVTAFLYFTKKFFDQKNLRSFLYACLFLGLIVILRQINGLIVLFIPFLAGSAEILIEGIKRVFGKPKILVLGVLACFSVVLIQLYLWYLQTGEFFVYSYQGDGFNWLHPEFYNILFSYRKGLFVYTPVVLFGVLGIVWMAVKKNYYLAISWGAFFVILTYFLSAWQWWYYGGSYGLRAYIEFYPVFFIPFALFFNRLKKWSAISIFLLTLLTIPVNLIQTYQYQKYILHASDMTKEKYWKVFLKTHERYYGILWQKKYDFGNYHAVFKNSIQNINVAPKTNQVIWQMQGSDMADFGKVSVVHVSFDGDFKEEDKSRLVLRIIGSDDKLSYYYRPYIIQFAHEKFGQYQTGTYNYEFKPIQNPESQLITFELSTGESQVQLTNLKFEFLALH